MVITKTTESIVVVDFCKKVGLFDIIKMFQVTVIIEVKVVAVIRTTRTVIIGGGLGWCIVVMLFDLIALFALPNIGETVTNNDYAEKYACNG